MIRARAIPCLLLKDQGLVKTVKFRNPTYIGDPINAVKLFNEKEVDELIFLDITATIQNREPDFALLGEIAKECFMPFSYGGGIRDIESIKKLLRLGVEKTILNSINYENMQLLSEAAKTFGSSTIIAAIDLKKGFWGRHSLYSRSGKKAIKTEVIEYAKSLESAGAGELFLNSIDRDGTMLGYDIEVIRSITDSVSIPVIACGGAGSLTHIKELIRDTKVSAAAAGSMFVYHGRMKGVLINYPERDQLNEINKMS